MKKLIVAFLFACSMQAQEKVFNVQEYCLDALPFKKGQCDTKGNEYSFVFVDEKNHQTVFFFTDTKLKYRITRKEPAAIPDYTSYFLENESGQAEMRIHDKQDKIEFLFPNYRIYLKVGKSTKLE